MTSTSLAGRLRGSPFQGYAYAYPHKTAYRALQPRIPLHDAWAGEDKGSLFLYVHVPFCEMRCSFCNLFTQAHSRNGLGRDVEQSYLDQLAVEATAAAAALGAHSFSRIAIGGGTPTFLSADGLETLFRMIGEFRGAAATAVPIAIEVSPFTATPGRLAVLSAHRMTRVSLGVQSFIESETQAAGRAQPAREVNDALSNIRNARIPNLNVDLIYGLPGQTVSSWLQSVRQALQWSPEELYLYPLYVRPMTGLDRRKAPVPVLGYERGIPPLTEFDELRTNCYREALGLLLDHGYEIQSMRHFKKKSAANCDGPVYCCQDDGMLGIGCGSRSYTRTLHYSNEYAVGGGSVGGILTAYLGKSPADLAYASHGFILDADEQRRRYLIKSLLRSEGLDLAEYRRRFESDAFEDLPELKDLMELSLAGREGNWIRPTLRGLECSDVIGPWLASAAVRESMQAFVLR